MPLVIVVVLASAIMIALVVLGRANELFLVSIREGRVLLVRGQISPALLNSFADVVGRCRIRSGSLRGVRSDGHARLIVDGADEGTAQRLRNAFGAHPSQKLSAAPLPSSRNIGQVLGWAWLAWMLARHR